MKRVLSALFLTTFLFSFSPDRSHADTVSMWEQWSYVGYFPDETTTIVSVEYIPDDWDEFSDLFSEGWLLWRQSQVSCPGGEIISGEETSWVPVCYPAWLGGY